MTVGAFVLYAESAGEASLYIPVATEAFFKACWEPAIAALNLQWTACFSTDIDIELEDLPTVFAELQQVKEWAEENLDSSQHSHLIERIEGLITRLPIALQRDGAIVFIG